VWDLTRPVDYTEAVSFGPDRRDVDAVGFGPDGRGLLVLGKGGVLRRWDGGTGLTDADRVFHLSNEWRVPATPAAFSGDGRRLAAVSGDDPTAVKVIDTASGRELATLRGHTGTVWYVACDATGTRVATAAVGMRDGEPLREVKVWDATTGQLVWGEATTKERTLCIAINPDGTRLAEARIGLGDNRWVALWTVGESEYRGLRGPEDGLYAVALAFSPDGSRVAAASAGGSIYLWDRAGERIHSDEPIRGPEGLAGLAFNPDGSRLAGVTRDRVHVWDVASGQDVLFLRGAVTRPTDNGFNPVIAWSRDGTRLAASNWNRTVSVWEADDPTTPAGKAALARRAAGRAFDWHLGRAEWYAGPGTTFAADFHRRRAAALDPGTPARRRHRGDFHARSGRWAEAAADFAATLAPAIPAGAEGLDGCAALLLTTDPAAYRELRSRALRELGTSDDVGTLSRLVRAGVLAPSSPDEAAALLAAARRWAQSNPRDTTAAQYLGLALVRAGEWDEAARVLGPVVEAKEGVTPVVGWLAVGLAHLRRGAAGEARPWLAKADAWLAAAARDLPPATGIAVAGWDWAGYLTARALRREADSLSRP
jgi:WD40 repeat protein